MKTPLTTLRGAVTGALVGSCLGMFAAGAHAAGLGRLTINSTLGQPLNAEIEIVSLQPGEFEALTARVASVEAYQAARIEYQSVLRQLRFTIDRRAGGQPVLRITSSVPVNEPFVDLLVDMTWPTGRLQREYPILLDPPGFAEARVQPPQTSAAATPAIVTPIAPPQVSQQPATPIASVQSPPARPVTTSVPSDTYGPVKSGDTLYKIAQQVKPEAVSVEQMLTALYRENPGAFAGNNMNRLKAGQILRVPGTESVARVTQQEAQREIRVQVSNWKAYRQSLATAAGTAPARPDTQAPATGKIAPAAPEKAPTPSAEPKDVLRLSKSETGKAAGKASARDTKLQEDLIAREKALKEAQSRSADLEKQVADMRKLVELRAAEAQKATDAKKAAQTKALAEAEAKKLAEAKKVADAKAAEEAKKLAEAKKAAEAKAAADAEAKKVAEAKAAAEAKKAADAKAAADAEAKRVADAKAAADAKKAADAKAIADAEAKKQADAKAADEAKKVADAKAAEAKAAADAEAKKVADAKAAEDAKKLADAKKAADPPKPSEPPKPVEKSVDKAPAPKVAVVPPAPEKSFVDEALEAVGNPYVIAGGAGGLALLGGFIWFARRRRVKEETTGPVSNLTSAFPSDLKETTVTGKTAGGLVDTGNSSFLTDFDKTGPGTIDTDEVDPVAEAEVYIAYGRDAQAEEILKEAWARDKRRHEIPLKLLEIYHTRKSAPAFESVARELHAAVGDASPIWAKAAAMGAQIDPSNPLYAGAAAAGAAYANVTADVPAKPDLDFDIGAGGGQAAASVSLDFDIGGGGQAASDIDLGATQKNIAPGGGLDFDLDLGASSPAPAAPAAPVEPTPVADKPAFDFDLSSLEFAADKTMPKPRPAVAVEPSQDFSPEKTMTMPARPGASAAAPDFERTFVNNPPVKPDAALMPDLDLGSVGGGAAAGDSDAVATKLELAKAYMEIGDKDGAREILAEVMREASGGQKAEAERILASI
jgi:pilus assembly protein FimV